MNEHYPFINPPLPYSYDSMEPYIDTKTMELHHDRHLQTYVDNLNQLLKENPAYQGFSLEQLVLYACSMPDGLRTPIRNNAGGVYNHLLYFSTLQGNGPQQPSGALGSLLQKQYGSYNAFQQRFTEAALSVFGSGYAWLVQKPDGSLDITRTANQNTPLSFQTRPLICIDVWEHAYYLKHYNKRADYIKDWFAVADWEQAGKNFLS